MVEEELLALLVFVAFFIALLAAQFYAMARAFDTPLISAELEHELQSTTDREQ